MSKRKPIIVPDRTRVWVYDPFCMYNEYCPSCGMFCHLTIYKEHKDVYSYLYQCKYCGLNYQSLISQVDLDKEVIIDG